MAESELLKIDGVGPKAAKTLDDCGFNTIEKIAIANADELAQLPGIGKATAKKIVTNAKKLIPKAPAKKAPAKKTEISVKEIPKPPVKKAPVRKTPVKKPATRPSVRPSVKEPTVKKPPVAGKISVTQATQKAINSAPAVPIIKQKKTTKKQTKKKVVRISKTFGIVQSVVHDRAGKSSNRSIILSLYETEIPLESYLGRKVRVHLKSGKELIGTITRIHGKRKSVEKTVIVRFSKGVSPHIITSRAIVL